MLYIAYLNLFGPDSKVIGQLHYSILMRLRDNDLEKAEEEFWKDFNKFFRTAHNNGEISGLKFMKIDGISYGRETKILHEYEFLPTKVKFSTNSGTEGKTYHIDVIKVDRE